MEKRFIKATEDFCTLEKHVAAPYLRRSFDLAAQPSRGEIEICGLGFYRLFINGVEITKGLLAPYVSNPDHYCYYDRYDLTDLLTVGKNTVGVILGNGFMNAPGGYVWDFDKAPWRGAPRVALELTAETDEETVRIVADEVFKVAPSPICFDDRHYGEYYDATKEIEGWNLPAFDDSKWRNALPADAPLGEFRLCKADPVGVTEVRRPTKIVRSDKGFVYDFGENLAGLCLLKICNAKAGQKVTLRYAERMRGNNLYVDGTVFPTSRFPDYYEDNQKDIYICRGGVCESWIPSFTYHGFRYVEVTGVSEEQATEELLTYQIIHSKMAMHGDFKCSDETVNTLFRMVRNSDLSNFHYYPTDCPHREKNGWTGDAAASCFHMMMLYDCAPSFGEWMANIRKSQDPIGRIPGIIPTAGWGYKWGNGPAWDCAMFYIPYECWRLRGDTQIIKDNADLLLRYLKYILTRRQKGGTVAFGLGDWSSVGRSHSKPETPLAVTDSLIVMDMAKKGAEMFRAIGYSEAAALAELIYRDMRKTVRRELLDADACVLQGRTQTGQAMGLYMGVFEPDEEQKAFDVLVELIHEKEDSFDCGMLGLLYVFHVLSQYGRGELALHMIAKREFPSYAYLIDRGETTLIERFMSEDDPCDSHNHHFFGDIARWFIREIAGLRVEDHHTVIIRPDFMKSITSAEAYYQLPSGRVSVKWETEADGSIQLEYCCPEDVDVQVLLPENVTRRRIGGIL